MEVKLKVTVIGCGRWGSFIAWYLDKIHHQVTLYGRTTSERMKRFQETRKNDMLTLADSVLLETDLARAIESETIVISINSQALRGLMDQLKEYDLSQKYIVLCMKGIEIETGERLTQIVREYLPDNPRVAVWLGPGHVQEFCNGISNCMVIDSEDEATKKKLVQEFSSDLIRFYYGTDLIGNEIGGATKNVIGIAAGMLDGLHMSSLKGALTSRGTREVARLIKAMGGNELSAYGLCHLGDYGATVFSEFSNNRKFGEMYVKGEPYEKLAEGYYTVKAIKKLEEKYQVEMPICNAVYEVLYQEVPIQDELKKLFARSLKKEF